MSIMDYAPRGLMEWAPVIGAGTASGGAVLARMFVPGTWFGRNADVTGWLAALGVAGAFAFTGRAGEAAAVALTGTAAALPNILNRMANGGLGYVAAETANPLLGMVRADQINGLGYATASPQPHAYGTVPGVAGAGGFAGPMQDIGGGAPISLLGPGGNHMGLAARYGTTHMSH